MVADLPDTGRFFILQTLSQSSPTYLNKGRPKEKSSGSRSDWLFYFLRG